MTQVVLNCSSSATLIPSVIAALRTGVKHPAWRVVYIGYETNEMLKGWEIDNN